MEFDKRAVAVLNRLYSRGYQAHLVGGCVRDFLRNVVPHDYDVTTSALPEELLNIFSDVPVIETGLKHGTVTVVWEKLPVEVTTYRVDGDYPDGRHPKQVCFTTSLSEDLARRDFTVNAMAWSPGEGLIDPFGGQADLKEKRLRCVGDASLRFSEDALRMLRALRFASVFGFSLEAETERALRQQCAGLCKVSSERIREEFVKLLCGSWVYPVLSSYPRVLGVFLPEILPAIGFDQKNYHHIYDVYTHILHVVDSIPAKPHLRLAALLHDIGKPETFCSGADGVGHFYGHAHRGTQIAEDVLRRLRFDNQTRRAVVSLIRYHDAPVVAEENAVRRKLNQLGPEGYFDLLALARADNLAQAPQYRGRQALFDAAQAIAEGILAEKQCFSLKDLAVNGNDVKALGLEGPQIGSALSDLLNGVLDGEVPNERSALLRRLSEKKRNWDKKQ